MSVSYMRTCERCGQPYTVEEFDQNYVIRVGRQVAVACPVCGDDFPVPEPLKKIQTLGEVLSTVPTEVDDGGA